MDDYKETIKKIFIKASLHQLSRKQIRDFSFQLEESKSEIDLKTLHKFCIRLCIKADLESQSQLFHDALAEYYNQQIPKQSNLLNKYLFLKWKEFHKPDNIDFDEINEELKEFLITLKDNHARLNALLFLDGLYNINLESLSVQIRVNRQNIHWKLTPLLEICTRSVSPINSNQFSFHHKTKSWNTFGITKQNGKKSNDDNLMYILFDDDSILLAIADGCGSSTNGMEASRLAIEAIQFAYQATKDLTLSVRFANSYVRQNNLIRKVDGETTLLVMTIDPNLCNSLMSFGDSIYTVISRTNGLYTPKKNLTERYVLGIEPLGDSITSSGNLLKNLNSLKLFEQIQIDSPTDFLLASDGILTKDDIDFTNLVKQLTEKDISIVNTDIIIRCNEALIKGMYKPDNISIISGRLI